MATVRIGGAEAQAVVAGGLDGELECEFPRTQASRELMALAVPGAAAVVIIAGAEFPGRIRITDPDEYVTVVDFS